MAFRKVIWFRLRREVNWIVSNTTGKVLEYNLGDCIRLLEQLRRV